MLVSRDTPLDTARGFLRARYGPGRGRLVYRGGQFWIRNRRLACKLPTSLIRSELWLWLDRQSTEDNHIFPIQFRPRHADVKAVLECVKALATAAARTRGQQQQEG
jgi:hypothetical protein